ncbi:MAG: uracil-xanthine permease, partial [Clostridia bacterium]|nr:uracil-xanthine permease [Clostridia bacterium]
MKLVYNINDKPKFPQLLVFALQQLLAIMAATLVVPVITGYGMSPAAALVGAGAGTIVYLLFTKFRSPVFLGSSFAFLGSMAAAFAGASTVALGYLGLIIGAILAGLVYVIISIIVKFVGVAWINKLMPAVVIGPTVAIIGLSLASDAVGNFGTAPAGGNMFVALLCGLITLATVIACSVYGKRMAKLIPFVLGILAGYAVALVFTVIGNVAGLDALKVLDFSAFKALVADGVSIKT